MGMIMDLLLLPMMLHVHGGSNTHVAVIALPR